MLALLQLLIFGHVHKWRWLHTIKVYAKANDPMAMAEDHVVECEKCGKRKAFRVYKGRSWFIFH